MSSPYKKMKTANKDWVGYTNISKLDPHMPYRITNIVQTNHPEFGPGRQAHIIACNGRKWRTQLPGKYLAQLTAEDLELITSDVRDNKNVFLVFREKMLDNSYRIDITQNDALVECFQKQLPVPELEDSVESNGNDDAANPPENAANPPEDAANPPEGAE